MKEKIVDYFLHIRFKQYNTYVHLRVSNTSYIIHHTSNKCLVTPNTSGEQEPV